MARGINKVILVGTLGKDPEVKYMPSGGAITNITIATNDSYKDKNTGEKKEVTEWHRVVFFNKLAEIAGEYLRKGQQVYIEGSLRTRKWQGQDGQDRYTTEIIANDMQMLGGRSGGGMNAGHYDDGAPMRSSGSNQSGNNYSGGNNQSGNNYSGGYSNNTPSNQNKPAPSSSGGFEDFDDDIPF